MQVSRGLPHMLTSNHRGRGNDPVVVLGRVRLAVAVSMGASRLLMGTYCHFSTVVGSRQSRVSRHDAMPCLPTHTRIPVDSDGEDVILLHLRALYEADELR